MSRFVILRHVTAPGGERPTHWDFMLETGDTLLTWALSQEPEPDRRIAAQPLPSHRPFYLDYEGPISDGRGTVHRWDHGLFAWQLREQDLVRVQLAGRRLHGIVRLMREPRQSSNWWFHYSEEGRLGSESSLTAVDASPADGSESVVPDK